MLVPPANGQRASTCAALTGEIQLQATDDEVRQLFKQFGFDTPLTHLEQAIDAHTRSDWPHATDRYAS